MRQYKKIFKEAITTSISLEEVRDYIAAKGSTQVYVEAKSDLVGKKGVVFNQRGNYKIVNYPKYILLSEVNGSGSIYLQTGFYEKIDESINSITFRLVGSPIFITMSF